MYASDKNIWSENLTIVSGISTTLINKAPSSSRVLQYYYYISVNIK